MKRVFLVLYPESRYAYQSTRHTNVTIIKATSGWFMHGKQHFKTNRWCWHKKNHWQLLQPVQRPSNASSINLGQAEGEASVEGLRLSVVCSLLLIQHRVECAATHSHTRLSWINDEKLVTWSGSFYNALATNVRKASGFAKSEVTKHMYTLQCNHTHTMSSFLCFPHSRSRCTW